MKNPNLQPVIASENGSLELWRMLQNGNEHGLHQLYHLYRDGLFNYGKKFVKDEEMILNSMQELFLHLWNLRNSLSEAKSVKAYLFSSLRRILLNALQSNRKFISLSDNYEDELNFSAFSPEDIVILDENSKLKSELIANLLNTLTARQKEIIHLKYYEDLTIEEIAFTLNINYQSVINHLQRAFLKLRNSTTPEQLSAIIYATGFTMLLSAF